MPLPCDSTKNLYIFIYQLKSLEITLAGSLRREHVADASIKKLEAEIEHLNRLVYLHCSHSHLCLRHRLNPFIIIYL